jgi:hypothetical protein
MRALTRIALLLGIFLITVSPLGGDELLRMRVSALAPDSLTVQVSVRHDADNRALAVTAEGPDFYRSSQIELHGTRSPRTTVFELRGLPGNMYEVTGILIGPEGPRATTRQMARVWTWPTRSSRLR